MIRKGYVDTPGGQIHVLEAGRGRAIVFIHQTSDAATMWEPALPRMAALGYRAVAIDLPNHGESYRTQEDPKPLGFASAVHDAARALGIKEAAIVGHHFGGIVAGWCAAEWPTLFNRLLVYGWGRHDAEARKVRMAAVPRKFAKDGKEIYEHWLRRWDMSGRLLENPEDSRYTEAIAVRAMISYLQAGENWCWAYHTIGSTNAMELAKRIRNPVLLFAGPRDHLWDQSQAAVGDFPDARFVAMPWVGPDAADEEPDAFCTVIDEFLKARR